MSFNIIINHNIKIIYGLYMIKYYKNENFYIYINIFIV